MREIDERMFEAAEKGDAAGIKAAIADGADIRARDNGGRTAAMLAAREGILTSELAETLARLGCPMDARDHYGWTVAMRAVWQEEHLTPELEETLARLGCPMDARNTDGMTVAMLAAWNGHLTPELAETLARLGCPMDARDKDGMTVAMRAIRYGRPTTEMAETLARLGCPMDARDNDGRTVAMHAAWHGHLTPELVECFVKNGCPMDARDNDGWTVAMHAAWYGNITPELVECLVKYGCPMDDIRIGENTAEGDRFASFAAWAKYAPGMAPRALDSFSNARKRAAGALALLSSGIVFDEETLPALAATFSESREGAVGLLLDDEKIFRTIDGARFLELVSSGRALKTMDAAAVRNLLSMCRSMLDERPEKLAVVKTALSKTFAGTLDACADDPETAELLSEVAGRIAALDDAEAPRYGGGAFDEPCL